MRTKLGPVGWNWIFVVCISAAAFPINVRAVTPVLVTAPNALASAEGNTDNGYPFSVGAPMRYQQIYSASQFLSLPPGGGLITKIAFRADGVYGTSFSLTLSDVRIDLSTSSAAVDGLSADFFSNTGPDATVVFARGPLALSGTGGASPNPFNIVINLTTPFLYNPAAGNLLMDVRNFGGGFTPQFDASNLNNDGISRAYNIYDANAVSASDYSIDSIALVTQFTIQPIPEPAVGSFLLLGVPGLLMFLRRARSGREASSARRAGIARSAS